MQHQIYDNSNLAVPFDVDGDGEIHMYQDREAIRDALATQTPVEFEVTAIGLVIHGRPSFDEWLKFGLELRRRKLAIQWALGDWINYGETSYGEKYAQAMDDTDYDYGTLRNYSYVASRFELSRRMTSLTFAHHVVVAPLPPAKADELLIEAKATGLTRDELRERVRVAQGKPVTKHKLLLAIPVNGERDTLTLSLEHHDIVDLFELAKQPGFKCEVRASWTVEGEA